MKRTGWRLLLAGLATAVLATSASAQIDYGAIQITADKMGPNLYMLSGSAGADLDHQDAAGRHRHSPAARRAS